MARFYYYVVSSGQQWEVTFQGQTEKYFYRTQADAIEAAAGAARKMHADGNGNSGVRIQNAQGQWRDERTYGEDPYPPRG